ncbi:dipeptidyl aminopeptidase/acylaminoacyl peptidase [Rheinheimera pacifica]|uniref:alpha/beta hydrolase family protein n=1 Tax=Rheinheimera pacifica TaxID=173990 RepID=UPI0021699C1F|nr:prolyl oligopeptidase family serine peptidase [Rheinheimera pacifica]MCS4306579.1 dipeptidyl aminopeptidase/acylaminoacyl peptidase [Rheinheimera pacifica]
MKPFLILLSSLLLATAVQAEQTKPKTGPELLPAFSTAASLKENFSCYIGPFASYDSWLSWLSKRPKFNTEVFSKQFPRIDIEKRQQTIDCRIFVYESDGILVEGVMLQPKATPEKQKLPIIIYNRGGNPRNSTLNYGSIQQNLMHLAEQGYIVIASQYRGAAGWETSASRDLILDEYGGADVNDVVNLLPIIEGMPASDSKRIAMIGVSRGSIMSYQAAVRMPQLKALVIYSGWSDLEIALETRPDMQVYDKLIPNYANNKSAELAKRSVLRWLDKLPQQLPILLLHGDKDARIDVSQARNMAAALKQKKQPYNYIEYADADHDLNPNHAEANAETAAWLKQYL